MDPRGTRPSGRSTAFPPRPLYDTSSSARRTYVKRPTHAPRDAGHDLSGMSLPSSVGSDAGGRAGRRGVHLINADELVAAVHDLCSDGVALRERLAVVEGQCATVRRVLESPDIAREHGGLDGFFERVPHEVTRLAAAVESIKQTQVADRIQLELEMKELRAAVVRLQHVPTSAPAADESFAGIADLAPKAAGLSREDVAPAQELSKALRARLQQRQAEKAPHGAACGAAVQGEADQKLYAFCALIQKDLLDVSAEQVRLRAALTASEDRVHTLEAHAKLRDAAPGGAGRTKGGSAVSLALRVEEVQRRLCDTEAGVDELREICDRWTSQPTAVPHHSPQAVGHASLQRPVVPPHAVQGIQAPPTPLLERAGGATMLRRESVTLADQLDASAAATMDPPTDAHLSLTSRELQLDQWEADLRRREQVFAEAAVTAARQPPPVPQPSLAEVAPAPPAAAAPAAVPSLKHPTSTATLTPKEIPASVPSTPATTTASLPAPDPAPAAPLPANTSSIPLAAAPAAPLSSAATSSFATPAPALPASTAVSSLAAAPAAAALSATSTSATLDEAFNTIPQPQGGGLVGGACAPPGATTVRPQVQERAPDPQPSPVEEELAAPVTERTRSAASTEHVRLSDSSSDSDLLPDKSAASPVRSIASPLVRRSIGASQPAATPPPAKPRSALIDDDMAAILGLDGGDSDVDSDPLTSVE